MKKQFLALGLAAAVLAACDKDEPVVTTPTGPTPTAGAINLLGNIFSGNGVNIANTEPEGDKTLTIPADYFTKIDTKIKADNAVGTDYASAYLTDPYNAAGYGLAGGDVDLSKLNLTVKAGSAAASGAVKKLDSWFEATDYKGAMGTANWMTGWANVNPQTMVYPTRPTVQITKKITANRTFSADSTYVLNGNIFVSNGATLTIKPGTIIIGAAKTATLPGGSLIVARGAKLMAEGTATSPIVFTSSKAAGARMEGDWGGVILLGKAPVNQGVSNKIEGISGDDTDGLYGGTDANDNSGVLKYVRIEFPGVALSPDNEINGLTFGGVGAGTTIDNIMVYRSGDDSYEWFGGTVNCKHLLSIAAWDDDFDTDFGFSGKVQFGIALRHLDKKDKSRSNGFESDNDGSGSDKTPQTTAQFANMTIMGPIKAQGDVAGVTSTFFNNGVHIRRNSALSLYNSIVTGFPYGIFIDATKVVTANSTYTNYLGK